MRRYLLKAGRKNREWKRRYFVLHENTLVYYDDNRRNIMPNGTVPLSEAQGVVWVGPKFVILCPARVWLLQFVHMDDEPVLRPRLERFVPLASGGGWRPPRCWPRPQRLASPPAVVYSGYLLKRTFLRKWKRCGRAVAASPLE